jgi:ParB family chromosome partitioning protein
VAKPRSKTALPNAKRMNAFAMDPNDLTVVGLDTDDGPEHPLYDERIRLPVDEGLVRNIRTYGVIEPVSVRKNGDRVEVVAGRQRVRAARVAAERMEAAGELPVRVPCMVRRDKDARAMGVMISENENRQDDDAVTRAQKAQRMLDYGQTEEDIAVAFGISKQAVKNLLAVLDLDDKVQSLVSERKLAYSTAITLRDLPREEQVTKASEMVDAGVGVAEAKRQERLRKASRNGKTAPDPQRSTRGRAVGVKVLRKVADDEAFMGALDQQARDMLRWILGDEAAAKRIKGLSALIKEES